MNDIVVHRLFRAGLALETALGLAGQEITDVETVSQSAWTAG